MTQVGPTAESDERAVPGAAADSLHGHVIVVAGGASGIGAATVRLLHQLGAHVICADRDEARACTLVADIDPGETSAMAITTDVTDVSSVARAVERTVERWGYIHGVVNCVGITGMTNLRTHEIDLADFDRVLAVNLRGALIVTQQVMPVFLRQRYGRLLHVASIAGKEGNAGMVSYSSSKAGLIGLVKSAGKEYAKDGITVNALAPAVIWTELVERMPDAQVEYMTSKIPMARLGKLTEAADMIAWIVSPKASFTTGFTFDLSGGRATY